ncbi:MAG: reverse transcriptase domain-containing protein [Gemmatimonadaceae bacterium]
MASSPYSLAKIASLVGLPLKTLSELAEGAPDGYRQERRRKESGGYRVIDAPNDSLKQVQRLLLSRVLVRLPPLWRSDSLRPRSAVRNAKLHRGQRHITALDIASAFPSVGRERVFAALCREGFTRNAAALVCKLCTLRGCLPQGAPTSPALMSLVLAPMDEQVHRAFLRRGIRYTRYADNISISGADDLGPVERFVETQLDRLGLHLNPNKTSRGGRDVPVRITGADVSLSVRVPASRVEAYRARVVADLRRETPVDVAGIRGVLSWMRSVNERQVRQFYSANVPNDSPLRKALKRKRRRLK